MLANKINKANSLNLNTIITNNNFSCLVKEKGMLINISNNNANDGTKIKQTENFKTNPSLGSQIELGDNMYDNDDVMI